MKAYPDAVSALVSLIARVRLTWATFLAGRFGETTWNLQLGSGYVFSSIHHFMLVALT